MIEAHDTEHSKATGGPRGARAPLHRWAGALAGTAFGAVVIAGAAVAGEPVHASALHVAVAIAVAFVFALGTSLLATRSLIPVGVVLCGLAAWLLAQTSYAAAGLFIAPLLGIGVGMAAPGIPLRTPAGAAAALASATLIVAVRIAAERDAAMAAAAALVALAAAASWLRAGEPAAGRFRVGAFALLAVLVAMTTTAWAGATTPGVTWFGSLTHHGPRDSNEVAITFDDGPNPPYTIQIRDILDAHGVKATFFEVGKAVDARPDVSRALMDDGHLLGNHSYHHDAVRWLDPGYGELQSTQDAFKRNLGACPALFRPPHGTHTPFMAHVVGDHGMEMVTWDVSAGDWATSDGELVAKRVLEKVKPGSIILLHDGIDGNIGADRSVILTALPLILEGLQERGLQPVTLDKLLRVPGYLTSC